MILKNLFLKKSSPSKAKASIVVHFQFFWLCQQEIIWQIIKCSEFFQTPPSMTRVYDMGVDLYLRDKT